MIQSLEKFSKTKVKLSVPLIASFITKRYRQVDIAKACNVSDQAVSQFIKVHYDELLPLVDTSDGLSALMSKHIATMAKEKINTILTVDTFDKKDLVSLNVVAGIQDDKYRLLSGKSTENFSIDAVVSERKEVEAKLRAIQEERALRMGISETENNNHEK